MAVTLTRERLDELVNIDPETGSIRWKKSDRGRRSGREAGSYHKKDGRHHIMIDGRNYLRYRVIWFYVHGSWPKFLDHINREKADDRIGNLRVTTTAQNMWNTGPTRNTSTGVKGVFFLKKDQKYLVQARRFQRKIHLGLYDDIEEARAAYAAFAAKHDGEFFHGSS